LARNLFFGIPQLVLSGRALGVERRYSACVARFGSLKTMLPVLGLLPCAVDLLMGSIFQSS
jgi:hypothetical protein